MALIACPSCKKEVSDSAKSCPHCGHALTVEGGAIILILFFVGILYFSGYLSF